MEQNTKDKAYKILNSIYKYEITEAIKAPTADIDALLTRAYEIHNTHGIMGYQEIKEPIDEALNKGMTPQNIKQWIDEHHDTSGQPEHEKIKYFISYLAVVLPK